MTFIIRALLLVTLSAVVPHAALAQVDREWVNVYEAKVRNGLPYRLMSPVGFDDNQRYPVIVSLHGAGGRGTDNRKQLKQWNQQLAGERIRKDYPCYVLAPQSTGLWDETHLRMIQAVIAELPAVDKDRIYMMGHSMGGHGSNILIQLAPKYFAAIAPSAGTGLKRTEEFIDPSKMKDVPIWAFHGDQDKVCPYDRNLKLFNELKELGGNMKLTTFKGDGHGIAGKMIPGADNGNTLMTGERCDPEPDFLKWLFAQRLPGKQAAAEEERTEVPSDFLKFNHGEVDRRYLIYRPKDLPDNAPLVFFLHGYRGDARGYMELGMNRVADTNGFAVCYPQGEKDRKGIPHWNARLKISKVDDIGFLSALAVYLQSTYKLDPKKTFACGISNGGFMSYTLVAEKPEVFKAAASVIGTMSGFTWKHRDQIKPVPILQISGLNDEIVPYDGSMSPRGGWGGAPNQDVIMGFWKILNQTKTEEVVKISGRTTAHYYKDGVNGNQVWHYKIKKFGHRFPHQDNGAGISSVEEIWKFFKQVSSSR